MDKKQQFAISALIPQLLGEAIYDTVCYYLKRDIMEMRQTIKVSYVGEVDIETLLKIKAEAFNQIMQTPKFRDMVLHSLNKVNNNKTDIVTETLTQYELSKGPQSTLMHDALSKEFDKVVSFLKICIKSYEYEFIYSRKMGEIPVAQ